MHGFIQTISSLRCFDLGFQDPEKVIASSRNHTLNFEFQSFPWLAIGSTHSHELLGSIRHQQLRHSYTITRAKGQQPPVHYVTKLAFTAI